MRITATQLENLQAIRNASKAVGLLPLVVNAVQLKLARKRIWTNIRSEHNLPVNIKFKVELDGPDAGELRRKDTSEAFDHPAVAGFEPAAAAATGRFMLITADDETLFENQADLFACLRDDYDLRIVSV